MFRKTRPDGLQRRFCAQALTRRFRARGQSLFLAQHSVGNGVGICVDKALRPAIDLVVHPYQRSDAYRKNERHRYQKRNKQPAI